MMGALWSYAGIWGSKGRGFQSSRAQFHSYMCPNLAYGRGGMFLPNVNLEGQASHFKPVYWSRWTIKLLPRALDLDNIRFYNQGILGAMSNTRRHLPSDPKWCYLVGSIKSADHLGMLGIPNRHTIVANPLNSKKTGTLPANWILKPVWRLACRSICRQSQSPTR